MLSLILVQHGSAKLHPGVRFKPPFILASADSQRGRNPAPVKQPAKRQGLLQAVRLQEKMPGRRLLKSRNSLGRTQRGRFSRARPLDRSRREPIKHASPAAVSRHSQTNPCSRQRQSSLYDHTA